jgi:hypothetical protein
LFIACLLLWIIFFPYYFIKRESLKRTPSTANQARGPVILCSNCGKYSDSGCEFCPHCGGRFTSKSAEAEPVQGGGAGDLSVSTDARATKSHKNVISIVLLVIGVLAFFGTIQFWFGGGLEEQASKEVRRIQIQVAKEAEKEFRIAKQHGNTVDAYVRAGLVAEAYLQAKDEINYRKWKQIEATEKDISEREIQREFDNAMKDAQADVDKMMKGLR